MPVVTAGLYSVILAQAIQGNPILNVFWYLEDGEQSRAGAFFLRLMPDKTLTSCSSQLKQI